MNRKTTARDREFMQLALELAAHGEGFVEPNPMVGCVIVKAGRIVGRGWHRRFGGPHAEIHALRDAGDAARRATVYVTLEPCSHHGKTPPCADALIAAGVTRVVVAMRDPNPSVSGRGLRKLRAAGIQTEVGLMKAEAAERIRPFTTVHQEGRPYVILKWAQSIDGKIATRSGDSKWISSATSRAAGHAIRARVDGVVIGVETLLADDPDLTARHAKKRRTATRIILDRRLRIPPTARVVKTAKRTPTLLVTSNRDRDPAYARRRRRLERAGCEVTAIRSNRQGVSLPALLQELGRLGMTNLLVEGGGRVIGAFMEADLADEAMIFVAPKLIGGETAPGPLRHRGPASVPDLIGMGDIRIVPSGRDICYNVRLRR